MKKTYEVKLAEGYSAVDHLGREVVARAGQPHASLAAARKALRMARKAHGDPRNSEPRYEIVRSDGAVFSWE